MSDLFTVQLKGFRRARREDEDRRQYLEALKDEFRKRSKDVIELLCKHHCTVKDVNAPIGSILVEHDIEDTMAAIRQHTNVESVERPGLCEREAE